MSSLSSRRLLALLARPSTIPRKVKNRVANLVETHLFGSSNIRRARQRLALAQTADFVESELPAVRSFASSFALLKFSLEAVDPALKGLYCEFGVYSGRTVNQIASLVRDTAIHGFDSFEGLPETWRDGFEKGAFRLDTLPPVLPNVILHKGWFDKTIPEWREALSDPIAFLHLDADLYSSTRTVLDLLADRIVPGTIMLFDEFFNYPGFKEGEYRAFMEFVEAHSVDFDYIGYHRYGEQLAVRIRCTRRLPTDKAAEGECTRMKRK